MTNTKPTIRSQFEDVRAILVDAGRDDLVEFIDGRIAQTVKKNSAERKPSAKQVENENIKSAICNWLAKGIPYTAIDVVKGCPACEGLTVQRVSALLSQLGKSGVLTVTEEKRKHFYSISE